MHLARLLCLCVFQPHPFSPSGQTSLSFTRKKVEDGLRFQAYLQPCEPQLPPPHSSGGVLTGLIRGNEGRTTERFDCCPGFSLPLYHNQLIISLNNQYSYLWPDSGRNHDFDGRQMDGKEFFSLFFKGLTFIFYNYYSGNATNLFH